MLRKFVQPKENATCTAYHSDAYTIAMVNTWQVQQISEDCTAFYGPRIGDLRVNLCITSVSKQKQTYLDIANQLKNTHQQEKECSMLEEKDLSQERCKALMRRFSWYNPIIDMTLFTREIYTECEQTIFVLSCMIPNAVEMERIDWETFQLMQTFKFKKGNS